MPPVEIRPPAPCAVSPAFAQAAQLNAASLSASAWAVFGRAEAGWETYAPLAAHEIGTACPGDADGFAQALSTWQAAHGLAASGVMDEGALDALRLVWLRRRPFVAATPGGNCPPPPAPDQLVWAKADEGYQTKPIQLRPEALEAWRALVGAARAQLPELAADHRLLTIFSGFRRRTRRAAPKPAIAGLSPGPAVPPMGRAWRWIFSSGRRRAIRPSPRPIPTGSTSPARPPTAGWSSMPNASASGPIPSSPGTGNGPEHPRPDKRPEGGAGVVPVELKPGRPNVHDLKPPRPRPP